MAEKWLVSEKEELKTVKVENMWQGSEMVLLSDYKGQISAIRNGFVSRSSQLSPDLYYWG